MANPISNWLYTGAGPGTQAATQAAAQTTPWGQVGKQILAEGAFGFKGKPGGFGSVNVGFDPKYTGKGATNILGYLKGGAQSVLGMGAQGNIAGGTGAGRLAFEKLLQSPLARGVGTAGRLATGPIGAGITAAMTGAQLGDWAYKNWEPATKFGDWAGGGIYDFLNPKETSIDPTGKNLFTQYHEDDPYAGIEGQTAMLGLPQLFGMITKGGISKQAIKKALIRNQIGKQIGKKVRPPLVKKLREKLLGEKFGGTGKFKTIATGTKDYGPHTKTKTKFVAKHSPHGGGSGSAPKTKTKTKVVAKHSPHGGGPGSGGGGGGGQKGSAPTGTAGRNPWGRADGGLINFYRHGGFI